MSDVDYKYTASENDGIAWFMKGYATEIGIVGGGSIVRAAHDTGWDVILPGKPTVKYETLAEAINLVTMWAAKEEE